MQFGWLAFFFFFLNLLAIVLFKEKIKLCSIDLKKNFDLTPGNFKLLMSILSDRFVVRIRWLSWATAMPGVRCLKMSPKKPVPTPGCL